MTIKIKKAKQILKNYIPRNICRVGQNFFSLEQQRRRKRGGGREPITLRQNTNVSSSELPFLAIFFSFSFLSYSLFPSFYESLNSLQSCSFSSFCTFFALLTLPLNCVHFFFPSPDSPFVALPLFPTFLPSFLFTLSTVFLTLSYIFVPVPFNFFIPRIIYNFSFPSSTLILSAF